MKSYKDEVGKIAGDLLKRDFKANNHFGKLTTDVIQFKVCDEKVYLSLVVDLYNHEIVPFPYFILCSERGTVWIAVQYRTHFL